MNNSTVLTLGFVFLFFAIASYLYAAFAGWSSLRALPWLGRIAALVAHLPDDTSKAWPHIVGGVLGFGGLSLLIAGTWDHFDELGRHLTVEVSGLMFALLISITAFWTLWQTKRIEQNQAVEMFGFKVLMEQVTADINELTDQVFKHPTATYPRFRLLLVTTNPYFGQLSYPGEQRTDRFTNAMRSASTCAQKNLNFKILCGNREALTAFHERYFKRDGAPSAESVKNATDEALEFIQSLKGAKVQQVKRVPKIQFAVIGNVVLEFILDTGDGNTDIQRYKRTHEKVVADRFADFFDELSEMLKQSGAESGPAGGILPQLRIAPPAPPEVDGGGSSQQVT